MKRIMALILAVCMATVCLSAQADVSTPTDLTPVETEKPAPTETSAPTDTDVPTETEAPTDTDVPTKTDAPADTDAPTKTETPADTDAPTKTDTPADTDAPTKTDAPVDTDAPTKTETPADTDAPTKTDAPADTNIPTKTDAPADTDTPTDTAAPEPTPLAEETETPAPAEWDESLCDHMNPNCQDAPACDAPNCAHISADVHGLDVPQCALGRWLIGQQEANGVHAQGRAVIDLDKGDAVIWRSGAYQVQGGKGRKASVTVVDKRTVALYLKDAALDSLTLGVRDDASLHVDGRATIRALSVGEDANVIFCGDGALTIDQTKLPGKSANGERGKARVIGGSLRASFTETDGRQMYAFAASGVTSAQVDGAAYALSCADGDGKAYLWLSAPAENRRWTAEVNGGVLEITQTAVPEETGAPTDAPSPTGEPAQTEMPAATDAPDPTPASTDAPTQTGSPADPEPPTDTETPAPTAPAATDEPAQTETPEPTQTPDPTPAPTPQMSIDSVQCAADDDGTVVVRVACSGAGTAGVAYVISEQRTDLPVGWSAQAAYVRAEDGQAVIAGVRQGQTVSLRAFACAKPGAELTAGTADGFIFSDVQHVLYRLPFVPAPGAWDTVYTGSPYRPAVSVPEEATVTFEGQDLEDGLPVFPGAYVMRIAIPEDSRLWQPGVQEVRFAIEKAPLRICPEPNQQKYAGEEDPPLRFRAEGLLNGDEVAGALTRAPGEEMGNYAFTLDGLTAPRGYAMTLAPDAPTFTILPTEEWFQGAYFGGAYEKLYPVKQEILRADGRSLYVILNTQDKMTVKNSVVGQVVRATEDDRPCNFTPSLSYDEARDRVLLRLRMEPELNEDKGFATNPDGSLLWGGRCLRISWLALRNLHELGVDAISVHNGGAALTLPLEDLLGEEMQAHIKTLRGSLQTARFRLTIVPTTAQPEGLATLRPVTDGWAVDVAVLTERGDSDITGLLPGLRVSVDLESVAALMASAGLYDEATFAGRFTLALCTDAPQKLDAAFVAPFMPGETETAGYPQLMYTHRYLWMPLREAGSVWCVRR